MMGPPALTVVVPARNEAAVIARCLRALPRRNDVEIVVADDGSTDDTAQIVATRFPDVRLLRLDARGSAKARAHALELARAPRIAFLDADCVADEGFVEAAIAAEGIAMGRVRAEPRFRARLVALLELGEFAGDEPGQRSNFALLNVSGPASVFRSVPLPDVPHGHDRLWSWRLARAGHRIRFEPRQSVLHAPRLTLRDVARRQASYARRFAAIRRIEPELPAAELLRLGLLGAPLIALGRLGRDLVRLRAARAALGIDRAALPIYALALGAMRGIDALVLARESLRSDHRMPADRLARDTLGLASSTVAVQLLHSLRSFVGARVLGIELFGVWQGVRIPLQLAQLSDLGSLGSLQRDVPLARGRGDEARARRVAGSAFAVSAVGAMVVAAGSCAAAAAAGPDYAPALAAAAAAVLFQQLFGFLDASLRADARLRRSAAAGFVRALAGALLAAPLAFAFGVPGFVGAVALGSAAGAVASYVPSRRPPARLRLALARELVSRGAPIRLARATPELMRTIEKLFLLWLSGKGAAGLYGLADAVGRLLLALPEAAATSVAPHALRRYAESGDRESLLAPVADALARLSRIVPLLAGAGALVSEPAIALLLPDYGAATTATKLLCLAMGPKAIEALSLGVLVALDHRRSAALIGLGALTFAAAVQGGVVAAGGGIGAVAFVSLATSVGLALAWLAAAIRALDLPGGPARRVLPGALLRLGWGAAAFFIVELARDVIPGGVAGRIALLALLVAPTFAAPRRAESAAQE
jgi:O-antigen/teichoic acid export membrane protein/glycosyltransferase involved in cell wall biosynthesis